jgi:hypothetical protein
MSGVEQIVETDVPLGDCQAPSVSSTMGKVPGKSILTSFS